MIINKIELYNFGSYEDSNIFNFKTNKDKNIILIGGKNGAGKTTLFTAIRLAIYGYKAYGYEKNNQRYFDEIYKLINDNEKGKNNGCAKVELTLLFDDGMYNNEYIIRREWNLNERKITEDYNISLNGKTLEGDELVDFENYLLHIIPPNLFKFYFFDGEKISEIFLQNNQDNSFKNAFLTMTGYDNIDLMIRNFKRNVSNKTKDNSIAKRYFELQSEIENMQANLVELRNKRESQETSIIEVEDDIAKLEKDYEKDGGLSVEKWKEYNKEIINEEAKREEYHRVRKDLANTEIPYIILNEKLKKLKEQIEDEDKLSMKLAVMKLVNKESLKKLIGNVFDKKVQDKLIDKICSYIDEKTKVESDNNFILLGLSNQEKGEVLSQIEKHNNFDKSIILKLYEEIKKSLSKTQRIRKTLEKSNIEHYEEFLKVKQNFLNTKSELYETLNLLDVEMAKMQTHLEIEQEVFKKVKKEYEEVLKTMSVNDISSRALLALEKISEELLRSQIDKVDNNFKKIFSKIINKKDFIDGIYIDEKLNIYPYKNVRVSKDKIEKLMNDKKDIIDVVGTRGKEIIEKHINDDKDYIDLPMEITSPFSQGERQVYIMSIYFALMQISRVDVPFVIDTPFARIDKEHRSKIVKYFFTKLKGQVFILSTDEEINDEYMNDIKDSVSNKFLLEYISRGKTKVHIDSYFGS